MMIVLAIIIAVTCLGWLASSFAPSHTMANGERLALFGVRLLCVSTLNAWAWIPSDLGGQGGPKIAILAVALACLVLATNRSTLPQLPLSVTAFLGIALLAALVSSDPATSLVFVLRLVLTFAVAGLAAIAVSLSNLRRLLVEFAALVAGWLAAAMVVVPDDTFQAIRAPLYKYTLRLSVVDFSKTNLSVFGIVLLIAAIVSTRRRVPLAVAGLAMLVLPQSRALIVAAAVFFAIGILTTWRRLILPAFVVTVIVVTSAVAVPSVRDLWDREQAVPQVDNAFSYRSEIFNASVERFRDKPILGDGIGVGNVGHEIETGRDGIVWPSHSEVGAGLSATGILGTLGILWIYAQGILLGWRRRSTDSLPLATMIAMLAITPMQVFISNPTNLLLPYLLVVIPAAAMRRESTETDG